MIEKSHIRCKGVSKSYVKHHIYHETLKEVLFGNDVKACIKTAKFNNIRSEKHQLKTAQVDKTSMTCFDNKRHWITETESYAIGHKNIKK